ncbi:hypothetical protein [Georgenia sp. Z1491]|uniref:hypothetical protein n=1 Tax=Georgenia sp. Z1491 TaxID=3416707 RepID=UPI003CEECB48
MRTADRPPAPMTLRPLAAAALVVLGLSLAACAGGPGGPAGGSAGAGGAGGAAGTLPTSDDDLGLPDDAFDRLERHAVEAISELGRLTPADVARLAEDAAGDGELTLAVQPEFIRVHYSDDTTAPDEFHEAEATEWAVHTTDGSTVSTVAFPAVGEPERHPLTHPHVPEVPTAVLAEWVVTAEDAARTASEVQDGEIERIGVPDGIDRPLTTVVLRDGHDRVRVTVDGVTGEALNAVTIG